jgi:predicted ATPase
MRLANIDRLDVRATWPFPLTDFIGRESEQEAVRQLVRASRLVTLTGAGGSGKTRLALEVAADMLAEYAGAVWVVELAAVTNPALVPQVIAARLGVREEPGETLIDALIQYLLDKPVLLVLDNFEQVVPAASTLLELLNAAPHLRILVTSQVALRLRGEKEFQVPTLKLPDAKRLPTVDQLMKYEAIRLFVARAGDAKPDFELTEENAPAVVDICHGLDGLPLAIELAAARIKILTPQVMVSRLKSRMTLLTGGASDLPTRQKTLRATLEWSYSLLNEGEQMLFRWLGVFVGGCTLDAAEAICGRVREDVPLDVLDGLSGLVDKSLLRQQETSHGEPRFWMLQTIQEYALERLTESGEEDSVRQGHAAYYLGVTTEAEQQLKGGEQEEALYCLEVEHDNLRTALDGSLQRSEIETVAALAGALWRFWLTHGHISEGRWWLEKVLAYDSSLPASLRAKALHGAGVLAANQGDYPHAYLLVEDAITIYREPEDTWGVADALNSLGLIAAHEGNDQQAQAHFVESLLLHRRVGNKHGIAVVLHNLGMMAHERGDYEPAVLFYKESLELARTEGDQSGIAWALNSLGQVALDQGNYDEAFSSYYESLTLCEDLGDKMGIALCLERLAGLAGVQNQPERAARLFGAAYALRENMGSLLEPSYREAYEQSVERARVQIEPTLWEAHWSEGCAMSVEQLVDYIGSNAQVS